jgi:hypothetical protein
MPFYTLRLLIPVVTLLAAVPLTGQSTEALALTLDGKRMIGTPSFDRSNISIAPSDGGIQKTLQLGTVWHLFMSAPIEDEDDQDRQAIRNRPPSRPGLVLTNGAFIAGSPEKITDTSITIVSSRVGTLSFPREQVARVQFNPISDSAHVVLPEFATGVVSKSGLFAEGDIITFDENKVVIDSILAGPSTHSNNRLHAVVLAAAPLASSEYIVELKDGSLLLADRLSTERGGLQVTGLLTGKERIEADDLARLSAGARRVRDLTDLPYRRRRPEVANDSDLAVRTSPLMATPIRVDTRARIIEIPAGNAIASMVEQSALGFSVWLAVPSDQPPQNRVIFKIRTDNLPVFESPPMSSESRPLLVGFRAPFNSFIVLEVLPVGGQSHETPGLWIEPVLHTK